ncbi:hypothetical protein [Flavobacterium pedocola]
MASELNIYSLYKLQNEDKYYLLRTERPGFSNASQNQEDLAHSIEENKRDYILKLIKQKYNEGHEVTFDLIGKSEDYAIGDKLYVDRGGFDLNLYYLESEFGKPWILIGNSDSETDFLKEINDDDDLSGFNPEGKPKNILVTFVTENDFDLSKLAYFNTKDVRPTETLESNELQPTADIKNNGFKDLLGKIRDFFSSSK